MLYKELNKIINKNNKEYANLNERIAQLEEALENKGATETPKLKKLKFQRWQLIHDYATEISDLLLARTTEFTKTDCSCLDLIPYIVWNKMSEKAIRIVRYLYNEEKSNGESVSERMDTLIAQLNTGDTKFMNALNLEFAKWNRKNKITDKKG